MIFDSRFRPTGWLILVCAALLEAAVVLPFGFVAGSHAEIPAALAILAAVAAATVGGPGPGMAAAALGLALVAAFVAVDALAPIAIAPAVAVAGLVGVVADRLRGAHSDNVNEVEQLREHLRKEELRHRALVETLPLVTYVQEAADDGALLHVSPQID